MKGKELVRRYGLELLAVFLGVWLSLIAEAWRQDQIAAREERGSLLRLAQDLNLDIEAYQDTVVEHRRFESSAWLRRNLPRGDVPEDSVAEALRNALGATASTSYNAEYSALETSGSLGLLSNPELRRDLTYYYKDWPYLRSIEDAQREVMILLIDLSSDAGAFYGAGDLETSATPTLLPGWREALNQSRFLNFLARNEHLMGRWMELQRSFLDDARGLVERINLEIM
jgi:hypothetical protein